MAFESGNSTEVNTTRKVIERIVEIPQFKDVEVLRPVLVDKIVEVLVPVFKDYNVDKPVFVEKIIEVQKVKVSEVEVTVNRPVFKEKVIELPVYKEIIIEKPVIREVEKIIKVERVEIVPKFKEIVKEVNVPRIIYKDQVVNRPIFRERIVDVIKPCYKCQNCGHEVN